MDSLILFTKPIPKGRFTGTYSSFNILTNQDWEPVLFFNYFKNEEEGQSTTQSSISKFAAFFNCSRCSYDTPADGNLSG